MRAALFLSLSMAASLAFAQFGVVEHHDLVYTQGEGSPQRLDLYLPVPATVSARPGIVFVHGGGWSAGSKADFADWGRYYAAKGYVCVSVEYRLAPVHVWPAQIDDVQASVRWMRKYSAALALDPERMAALGMSAGGHLVQFLGTADTFHDADPGLHGYSSRVKAVVDYMGPTDFSAPDEWNADIWRLVTDMVGQPWSKLSLLYRMASPFTHVTSDDAPTLMFYGGIDEVVPPVQGRRMAARFYQRGVAYEYNEFPNEGHGLNWDDLVFSLQRIDLWFAGHLK